MLQTEERTERYAGICLTCINAPECSFLKNSNANVIHCEEFDFYVPGTAGDTLLNNPQSKPKSKDRDWTKGLCGNCFNIETCTFLKPEGGVWHCEEYL